MSSADVSNTPTGTATTGRPRSARLEGILVGIAIGLFVASFLYLILGRWASSFQNQAASPNSRCRIFSPRRTASHGNFCDQWPVETLEPGCDCARGVRLLPAGTVRGFGREDFVRRLFANWGKRQAAVEVPELRHLSRLWAWYSRGHVHEAAELRRLRRRDPASVPVRHPLRTKALKRGPRSWRTGSGESRRVRAAARLPARFPLVLPAQPPWTESSSPAHLSLPCLSLRNPRLCPRRMPLHLPKKVALICSNWRTRPVTISICRYETVAAVFRMCRPTLGVFWGYLVLAEAQLAAYYLGRI